jgi:biopolymer transport protein TolR
MDVQGQEGGRYQILSEINMVPFIDVVLVLLIIFMVMTPFLVESQIKVNLPTGKAPETVNPDDKPVRVQIQADGSIYIDGKKTAKDAIEKTLTGKLFEPKKQAVLIEADKSVQFENVVLVMGSAKKLGVTRIGVGVIDERKSPDRKK